MSKGRQPYSADFSARACRGDQSIGRHVAGGSRFRIGRAADAKDHHCARAATTRRTTLGLRESGDRA